ncbi:hypothetical protein PITC_049650 [Penicillium italicum]|uniref:Uncharacterized protein n=1 Tax=Penicillium italicum TaxID=40296 RepID=A0A0A2K9L6_PENIT|nr:hypothetical protein PITC_049650 [Penicillium italicum]
MRKENGIELSNWRKKKEKKARSRTKQRIPPLIETKDDDHQGRKSES